MHFRTTDHHAIVTPLHNAHKHVGVSLIGRGLAAITFWIGHGPTNYEVRLLHTHHEILETLVIVGVVRGIHFVRHGIERIQRIHAHAALETGPCELA